MDVETSFLRQTQLSFSIVSIGSFQAHTCLSTYYHTKKKCLKLHLGQRAAHFNVTVSKNIRLSLPQKNLKFGITC